MRASMRRNNISLIDIKYDLHTSEKHEYLPQEKLIKYKIPWKPTVGYLSDKRDSFIYNTLLSDNPYDFFPREKDKLPTKEIYWKILGDVTVYFDLYS